MFTKTEKYKENNPKTAGKPNITPNSMRKGDIFKRRSRHQAENEEEKGGRKKSTEIELNLNRDRGETPYIGAKK